MQVQPHIYKRKNKDQMHSHSLKLLICQAHPPDFPLACVKSLPCNLLAKCVLKSFTH